MRPEGHTDTLLEHRTTPLVESLEAHFQNRNVNQMVVGDGTWYIIAASAMDLCGSRAVVRCW